MTPSAVRAAAQELVSLHGRFAPLFGRKEAWAQSLVCLRGLLGAEGRQSAEPMALVFGQPAEGEVSQLQVLALQRFLTYSPWDAQAIQRKRQAVFAEQWVPSTAQWPLGTVGVIDGSGFTKKGTASVGVQRQYCGRLGKQENCQVGVFLVGVTPDGSALLDHPLYLPREWSKDKKRRECPHPQGIAFPYRTAARWGPAGRLPPGVKDNQPTLRTAVAEAIAQHFTNGSPAAAHRDQETHDRGHGRIEERHYHMLKLPADFPAELRQQWPSLKAIGCAIRVRTHADGTSTEEMRYYIASHYFSDQQFAHSARDHWGIESMHWVLDMNFREDENRTRERTLGNNLSWLRRFALTLLKQHPAKDNIKGKMQRAGWDDDFMTQVLAGTKP